MEESSQGTNNGLWFKKLTLVAIWGTDLKVKPEAERPVSRLLQ